MSCTLDPRFAALFFDLLPAIAASPILAFIVWMFYRGTKAWRGKEAMRYTRAGKTQWGPLLMLCVPSFVNWFAALLALTAWLYTTLW